MPKGIYKRRKESKKCPFCGLVFIPYRKSIKYCSPKCAIDSKKRRIIIVCKLCGKQKDVKQSHKNTKFCNNKCAGKYHRLNMLGSKHPLYGKKHSEETKRKISQKNKGLNKGIPKSELHNKKNREWHIKNPNRKFKETSIELKVEKELIKRKIKYKKQVPLAKIARVDFFIPSKKTIIQCDGDYWHNLPKMKLKDKRQDKILKARGFIIYRFWEHEINQSVEKCIDKILC